MEQSGYVFRSGDWWYLRYRDTVLENGEAKRKQLAHRLARVSSEERRLKRPPESVEELAKHFLRPLNEHKHVVESTRTLGEFVERVYFPHAESQKRASTVRTDRNRWERHLKPRCEYIRLRDFRTVTGEQLIAEIARQNDLTGATLKQLKSLLSAIFKHAKRQGFLDGVNPMQDVSIPRARKGKETYAYTLDEIKGMLTILPDPAKTIVAVAAYTGLRRSEIQGLRWEDYDDKTLNVRQSVWEGIVSETKTNASQAPVPVVRNLARILDTFRFTKGNPNSGVMFPASNGKPLRLNNELRTYILPALRKAKLEWEGWHAFRRGLATNLHDDGVDDHTIKTILRHSSVSVTQRSYIKTVPRQAIEAMDRFDQRLDTLNPVPNELCKECATESTSAEPERVN